MLNVRILRNLQGSLISSALIFMVLFTTYTADHIRACESLIPESLSIAVCCLMTVCLRSPE